jgi:hypothetical protein
MHNSGASRRGDAKPYVELEQRHCERSEAIHLVTQRKNGLPRGACHRARIRATRWLAMTALQLKRLGCLKIESNNKPARHAQTDSGIHQSSLQVFRRWITGSSSAKTRGACHRAALRADPLALLPGDDDFNWYEGHREERSTGCANNVKPRPPVATGASRKRMQSSDQYPQTLMVRRR